MKYKKPAFWIVVLCVLVCGAVAVCLLFRPGEDGKEANIPAVSDGQTENPDSGENTTVPPEESEAEDGKEVSPLLAISGEQIGTAAVYRDEDGRIIKKTETWNSGIVKETSYSYYPDGNKKEVTVWNGDALIQTKYRENGTVEIVREEHAKGTLETTYTETGSRSKLLNEYPDGSWEEQIFDSENRMIGWVQAGRDQFRRSEEFTYYENGNTKLCTTDDEAHGTHTEWHYNEDGSLAAIISLFGEQKKYPDVVVNQVRQESYYDAEGNRTTKNEYKDGKIEESRYDAKGTRVWSKVIKPDGSTDEKYYTNGQISRQIINGEEIKLAGS